MSHFSSQKAPEHRLQQDTANSMEREYAPKPSNLAHDLLALQRTAGNQAVTHLLQRARHNSSPSALVSEVPTIVNDVLRSAGRPLDAGIRAFMEPRFGYDFSQVRLHTDAQAAESAQAVNASAYTVGRDIVFGTEQYAPGTSAGRHLLAHELTHTIQQRMGLGKSVPFSTNPITDSAEQEADNVADTVTPIANGPISNAHGHLLKVSLSMQPAVQRQLASSASPQAESAANETQMEKDLDADFHLIVRKLDVLYYSDADEKEVFEILNKWAAVPNPPHSSSRPGSRYLERLFTKLQRQTKDVGILTKQQSNYYSRLFSRSSRLIELHALRNTHAPLYAGDEGVGETSFGSVLWENVEKGVVRDQIFAYGKGLGKGIYEGGKGFVKGVLHPVETAKGIYQSVKHFDETKANMKKLAKRYIETASEDPVKFAEMTGELAGQVEVALVTPKVVAKGGSLVAAGATRLASTAQRWGRIGLTGAMLGVGQVVPKIGAGSGFVRSAATMSTTARVVEASEQITAKAAALPKIQAATQIAQAATQIADDVAEVAQEATQATQSSASVVSIASTTSTTAPTLASIAGTVSPSAVGALGSPNLTGSVLTAVAQTQVGEPEISAAVEQAFAEHTSGESSQPYATTQRLIRGNLGERMATDALAADGHQILMHKPSILGTNQGGIDIATIRNGIVYLIDNKALTRAGNVSSVSALTTNFAQNLAAVENALAVELANPNLLAAQRVVLQQALNALKSGKYVRAVTNANVARDTQILSGVTQQLQNQGIQFIDMF